MLRRVAPAASHHPAKLHGCAGESSLVWFRSFDMIADIEGHASNVYIYNCAFTALPHPAIILAKAAVAVNDSSSDSDAPMSRAAIQRAKAACAEAAKAAPALPTKCTHPKYVLLHIHDYCTLPVKRTAPSARTRPSIRVAVCQQWKCCFLKMSY